MFTYLYVLVHFLSEVFYYKTSRVLPDTISSLIFSSAYARVGQPSLVAHIITSDLPCLDVESVQLLCEVLDAKCMLKCVLFEK